MRVVVISTSVQDLPERGEAWLVSDDGEVRAKFYDGKFIRVAPEYAGDELETLVGAA